jgi:hypothetical protein
VIIIDNTGATDNNKQQNKKDIYILAKKLAEFIGNLDDKKDNNNQGFYQGASK